jgi:hypothetical protein
MDGHVELRPIPNTNIFIIRQRTDSSLSSDCSCVSKKHYYTISFGVNRIQIVKVRTMFVSYNTIIQQHLLLRLTQIIIVRTMFVSYNNIIRRHLLLRLTQIIIVRTMFVSYNNIMQQQLLLRLTQIIIVLIQV